jgi:hypothetical protein
MLKVYEALGTPCGDVGCVLWSSSRAGNATQRDFDVDQLATLWLKNAALLG